MAKSLPQFYTYLLNRTPRDDTPKYVPLNPDGTVPFYVGKGCGGRMEAHFKCAHKKLHCPHQTCRVIRKMISEGGDFTAVKIAEGIPEEASFRLERLFVMYGKGVGWPLVNKTKGGDGVSGYRWTEEQREMRRQIVLREMEEQPERYNRFKYANVGRTLSPEIEEKRLRRMREVLAEPEVQEGRRQSQLKRWSDPEEIEKQRQRMSDPELVAINSAKNKGHTRKALTYSGFRSPEGIIFAPVHNLALFCKEHNLQKSNMCLVAAGKQHDHKGWTCYPPIEKQPKKISPPRTPYTGFLDPQGTLHTPTNLRAFCIEHDLQPSAMSLLNAGKLTQYKGWTKYHGDIEQDRLF